MLNKLKTLFELPRFTIPKLVCNPKNPTHRYGVAIYATLIEYARSSIVLFEQNSPWGVESILRSMLEAYFDLVNLHNAPDYYKRLEVNSSLQAGRLEKEIINASNPYVPEVTQEIPKIDFQSLIQANGMGETKIYEKMKLANSEDVYRSIYWLLCQESHNNLFVLVERHFETDAEGNVTGIKIFKLRDDQRAIIDAVAGMLTNSMELIGDILAVDLKEEAAEAKKILEEMRA